MTERMTKEERKAIFKEALKEWLTEQREDIEATVGRWFLRVVAVAAVVALGYFILKFHPAGRIL